MDGDIGKNALRSNPALKPFEILIGEWNTTGRHPFFPDAVLNGRSVFEWFGNGAFIVVRSEIDHEKFPDGLQVFGSDDAEKKFFMLHFDERGTSRKYDVYVEAGRFVIERLDPDFAQRFILAVKDGGKRIESEGHMRRDGGEWEDDLSLIYTRV